MKRLSWLLDRLASTALMAAGAALLTAGVLSYAPSAFGDWQTPEPVIAAGDPLFEGSSPSAAPLDTTQPTDSATNVPPSNQPTGPTDTTQPTGGPTAGPSGGPGDPTGAPTGAPTRRPPSAPPTVGPTRGPGTPLPNPTVAPTPRPTVSPNPNPWAHASRIRIPSLGIDLPVVASDLPVPGNPDFYPLCDVAMYMVGFVQPGESGTTYIYGHAQAGMFAPLLHASYSNNGASMIGSLVEVYTSDNKLHMYEIFLVKRHATDLSITRVAPGVHQLVLQTSEGWHGHVPKLQIAARPITVLAASHSAANPTPHPRLCLPSS